MIIQPDKYTNDLISIKSYTINSTEDITVEFIIDNITDQLRNLGNMLNVPDYMLLFFNRFLEIDEDDVTTIMDSSIYLDLSDEQKEVTDRFLNELNMIFLKYLGIKYHEEYSLRSMYHLYHVMVLNLNYYLYHYMIGLSKEFNEFIEHTDEFDIQKIEKKEMFDRIQDGRDRRIQVIQYLISYVAETSLFLEHFFDIISYSAEGDDSIEFLSTEYDTYRLTFYDSFFLAKLIQIMSSEVYINSITNKYMNHFKNIPII